jgi:hypothetical protein
MTGPITRSEAERALKLRSEGHSYAEIAVRLHRSRRAIVKLLRSENPKFGEGRFRCPGCGGLSSVDNCRPCELQNKNVRTDENWVTAGLWLDQVARQAWAERDSF